MRKLGMMWIYMSALIIMFCAQAEAAYQSKMSVTADSEERKEWEEVALEFDRPPVDNVADLIVVTNAVKLLSYKKWGDASNPNVLLLDVTRHSERDGGGVRVEVHGRENNRVVHSVKVELEVEDEEGEDGDGEPPIGWAEVKNIEPQTLVLRDDVSGRTETDSTIEDDDRPLLYCCTDDDGKGQITFWLTNAHGTYPVPQGVGGPLERECKCEEGCDDGHCDTVTDIDPGQYTQTVEAAGGYKKGYERNIDFVVVLIEIEDAEDTYYVCYEDGIVLLDLTEDSYCEDLGSVEWRVNGVLGNVGDSFTFFPKDTIFGPGKHTATAGCPKVDCESEREVIFVNVEEIEGPEQTTEGLDSSTFVANVLPEGEDYQYSWTAEWPAGVGHEPGVNFMNSSDQETQVEKAQWFAEPDSQWLTDTGTSCVYDIFVTIAVGDLDCKSDPHKWTVEVEYSAICYWPEFKNVNTIAVEEINGTFVVTGQGDFHRSEPEIDMLDTPETSDFYDKFLAHEEEHYDQWTNQDPWQNLFDADTLYNNEIEGLQSQVSEAELREQIDGIILSQEYNDGLIAEGTECKAEQKAYAVMRDEDPYYLDKTKWDVFGQYGCNLYYCGECP